MMKWQNAKVADVELSVRATNVLQAWRSGLTLGEIDKMSDLELLRVPRLGKGGLKEVREVIRNVRAGGQSDSQELINWVLEHSHLVRAWIAGEARIVVDDDQGEAP